MAHQGMPLYPAGHSALWRAQKLTFTVFPKCLWELFDDQAVMFSMLMTTQLKCKEDDFPFWS